jgi:hypothetical protein
LSYPGATGLAINGLLAQDYKMIAPSATLSQSSPKALNVPLANQTPAEEHGTKRRAPYDLSCRGAHNLTSNRSGGAGQRQPDTR